MAYFLYALIDMSITISKGDTGAGAQEYSQEYWISYFSVSLAFYSILFIADVLTIFYFINMSGNYIKILEQYYTINKLQFFGGISIIATWIIITIFRFDVFFNLSELIFQVS